MGTPARKLTPAPLPPTDAELARATERARLPDGTVHPLLLGVELAAPLGLNYDHDNRRVLHDDDEA